MIADGGAGRIKKEFNLGGLKKEGVFGREWEGIDFSPQSHRGHGEDIFLFGGEVPAK